MTRTGPIGRVAALWRYPVKSMAGEELTSCQVTERGLLGDRAYALVDEPTGVVGSAKNPRLWPDLLTWRAEFTEPPRPGAAPPPVRITLPNGQVIPSDGQAHARLSATLGKPVVLSTDPPEKPVLEQFWPDLDGTSGEKVTNEPMPGRTFFDMAVIHLLLTTTLERLSRAYPAGEFAVRRFRPNILVEPAAPVGEDPEPTWVGRVLAVGDEVRVRIDLRALRCVMTTLPQPGLPRDLGILRTVVRTNEAAAGVYGAVIRTGVVRVGDPLWLVEGEEIP